LCLSARDQTTDSSKLEKCGKLREPEEESKHFRFWLVGWQEEEEEEGEESKAAP
jgi:hypothetical protein